MDPFNVLSSSTPQTKLELFISCSNLKNKDILSKSDPLALVKLGEKQSINSTTNSTTTTSSTSNNIYNYIEIGRTEIQKNNLNPSFIKTFIVNYKFEEIQPIQFFIYDVDNESSTLNDDDFLGKCELKISDIVSKPNSTINVPLLDKYGNSQNGGTITIRAEEISKIRDFNLTLQIEGKNLAKKDLFGKSDPFFIISRNVNGKLIDLYKSEIIMNNLNPIFNPFTISMFKLCNLDENLQLILTIYDWDKHSDPDLKVTGKIQVKTLLIEPKEEEYTFIDYLSGGLEVSLIVSIDFTASNGNPTDQSSLHFGGKFNEYEMAIKSITDILSYYDNDKLFPSFGFGAKLPTGDISHCFALNGNPSNPNCVGVDGILQSYRLALNTVQLYGPTNFSPTIQTAIAYASQLSVEQSQNNQKYLILLILTDGEITDLPDTIKELVKASKYPLSVVIVGVGSADFSQMHLLDGDDKRLSNGNEISIRDIVQFVPFRKFNYQNYHLLARETLMEIPSQVVQYFKSMKIKPNKRN
ncbi:predicted protein [Naegleria gruberi]|uniref:Predicted protein n=1 Tax=Naegleria gruberi TaxID=5762 RepID=D2VT94_NAEGR|nr:uncharacterized protein NAEGRDRAFT_72220 [Naegleria gruberi]EFC39893.1 predicted protein [Naegleria gruberi]|eukprot:XP_002672637.1 predicted protein [Naegleria gruberi strain NEG-M]